MKDNSTALSLPFWEDQSKPVKPEEGSPEAEGSFQSVSTTVFKRFVAKSDLRQVSPGSLPRFRKSLPQSEWSASFSSSELIVRELSSPGSVPNSVVELSPRESSIHFHSKFVGNAINFRYAPGTLSPSFLTLKEWKINHTGAISFWRGCRNSARAGKSSQRKWRTGSGPGLPGLLTQIANSSLTFFVFKSRCLAGHMYEQVLHVHIQMCEICWPEVLWCEPVRFQFLFIPEENNEHNRNYDQFGFGSCSLSDRHLLISSLKHTVGTQLELLLLLLLSGVGVIKRFLWAIFSTK